MLEKSDLQTGQIFLDFDKFLIPGYAVSDIWIQEGSATAAVHQFKVLTYYSHCHGSVKVLDRKVSFAENLSYMKMQESSDSFERVPDYFTYRDSWFCHVTSSTEYTESMQFHQKVTSQNTHAVTMAATQRYLFLTPPNVEREKLLQGACLRCSLWTSVVQQSPLLSILMPTSNCENPSCFRRKSIPCVDRLPFGCIMFFAMKGSYEPENVFVRCFFMANSFCPPCSKKYNIALMVHGHLQNIQLKYIMYCLKNSYFPTVHLLSYDVFNNYHFLGQGK